MLKNLKSHLYLIFFLIFIQSFAQTGPGGVGSSDGTSDLLLWLKADSVLQTPGGTTASNGDAVGDWRDQSGYGLHIEQAGSNRPFLRSSGINGAAALEFVGDGDFLEYVFSDPGKGDFLDTLQGFSAYYIIKSDVIDTDRGFFDTESPNGSDNVFGVRYDAGGASSGRNDVIKVGITTQNGATQLESSALIQDDTNPQLLSVDWTSGSNLRLFFNGSIDAFSNHGSATLAGDFQGSDRVVVGKGPKDTGGAQSWDGLIGEIVLYSSQLNDAQRILVDNYLSSKFSIAIGGNDFFAYETNFPGDIAGIGRSGTDYHVTANSSGLLQIDTTDATSFVDGSFLLIGHDEEATSWTTSELPTNNLGSGRRISREWRLDETIDQGEIRFTIDTNELDTPPAGYTKYVLLIDDDGDFSNASTYELLSPGADEFYEVKYDPADGQYFSIGVVEPTLGFATSLIDSLESEDVQVSIFLNYIPTSNVQFDLATTDGTATGVDAGPFDTGDGNQDFLRILRKTVIFEANEQQDTTFTIDVNQDTQLEATESFSVNISDVTAGINVLGPLAVRINDDDNDRKLYFDVATSSVDEFGVSTTIQINLTPAFVDPSNPTTVDYYIFGGDATDTDDFSLLGGGTATIPVSNVSTTFDVSIVDDAIDENDETVIIALANPTNGSLSSTDPIQHTLTIVDNDPGTLVQFNLAASDGDESTASPSITVVMSAIKAADVEVDYSIAGNTTPIDDYSLTAGTITIPAGQITATISPIIIDDAISESDETIVLTLSNPQNANLGAITTHTYTIIDNDAEFGFSGPGGVGSTDGTSALSLWLKADAGTKQTDGTTDAVVDGPVGQWEDQSGSLNDFDEVNPTENPLLRANAINGQPALEFDGTDDVLQDIDGEDYVNGISAYSLVAVIQSDVVGTDKGFFDTELPDNQDDLLALRYDDAGANSGRDDLIKFGISVGGSQQQLESEDFDQSTSPQILVADWASGNDVRLYIDGDLKNSDLDGPALSGTLQGADRVIVGTGPKENEGGTGTWDGLVGEILMFTTRINNAQRIIFQNYLAAKYQIPITDDFYAYETTHGNFVAGIGQFDADEFHDDAQSDGILRINNPSSLSTGDYVFFGHDGTTINSWTLTESPVDSIFRIEREWALDATNYSGSIDVVLSNPTSTLGAIPADAQGYVLLVDDDGDFSNGGTDVYEMTQNGADYIYSGLNISSDAYLSFGTVGITAFFTITESDSDESIGTVDVNVSLSRASNSSTDINYSIGVASTATEGGGNDFTLSPVATLTIPALSTNADITITINDDADIELSEQIILDLDNADNNVFIRPSTTYTQNIQDNDAATATTGPGSIVTTDFAFWMSADSGVYVSDGGALSQDTEIAGFWLDRSGQANNATGLTGTEPVYRNDPSEQVNFKPVLTFEGAQGMTMADDGLVNSGGPYTEKTVVVAFETGSDVSSLQVIYEQGGSGNGLNIHVKDDLIRIAVWDNDFTNIYNEVTQTAVPNTRYLATFEFESNGADSDLRGYVNGALQGTVNVDQGDLDSHGGDIGIGQMVNDSYFSTPENGENGDGYFFTGKILELISANRILGVSERNLIDNYLAGKWDINISGGNDVYAYKTTHSFDVSGIGRNSATDFQSAAKSTGLLTISNATDLDDSEYLIVGQDNTGLNSYFSSDAPDANFERLPSEWRASVSGNLGRLKFTFDPSATIASPSADFSEYAILVDADGDFTSGAQVYTLYQNGAVFEASNIELSEGDYFTIAAFKPSIQFVPANETGDESATPVSIVIRLDYPVDQDVSVDYALDLVATTAMEGAGNDFIFAAGTASILRGDTTALISFTVNDDVDDTEGNEQVVIDLSNPNAGLFIGNDTTYTYIIEDNDLTTKVDFAVAATDVSENNGSTNITLKLNEIVATDVTVDYSITAGTATADLDYTLSDGSVTISAGGLTGLIPIPIINDELDEVDETIQIELSNPVGANLAVIQTHTLTILDDDTAPTVQFTEATLAGSEGNTPANLNVNLSRVSGKPIRVDYRLVSTTGTQGVDFSFSDGFLSFSEGDSLATISIGVIDDFELEVDEQIVVELFAGTELINTTLGAVSQATFTINDNDAGGVNGPGGVRSASDYLFWLRADKGVFNDAASDAVASDSDIAAEWLDYSGNGNNALATVSQEPVYRNNSTDNVNGKPIIEFSGNQELEIPDASGINQNGPFTNKTSVVAFQLGSDINTRQVIYAQGGGTNGFAVLVANDSLYVAAWNDNNTTALRGTDAVAQSAGVVVLTFSDQDPDMGVIDLRLDGYYNGVQLGIRANGTDLIDAAALNNHGNVDIGGFNNDQINFLGTAQDDFNGKVMELFSFNGNLSETQRIITENYLAAKYNVNITASSNDYYAYSGLSSFGVAGIGRENGSDFYPKAQSDSTVTISNASDLGDGEYLVWGHDNGSVANFTTTESPTDIIRLPREWRVSETSGDVGTITFIYDSLTIPAVPTTGYTKYALLQDTDGDFSAGAIVIPLTQSGSEFSNANVNFADGDHFTIGLIRPRLQFELANSNGSETIGSTDINIALNHPIDEDISFDVNLSGGTATVDSDFSFANQSLTISAGSTTQTVSLSLINDAEVESDETIILEVTNQSQGEVFGNTTHTFTINDDDNFRKADFDVATLSATEDLTSQSVDVILNAVDNDNETQIFFAITGGTAQNDSIDYYVQPIDTLIFPSGSDTQSIPINVINDLLDEFDETIQISLTGGSNATLGTVTTFEFTIQDEDLQPEVEFATATRSGSESFQTVQLPVTLNAVSGKDVTIPYSITGGSATDGVDVQLLDSEFIIPAGNLTDSLQLIIIDDAIFESPDEDFIITLGIPQNATNGSQSSLTYTILDNDGAGIDGPGGIGDLSGQIALWLRANDETSGFLNGVNVSQWEDATNNNNDGFQSTSNQQPLYLENLVNGRPALIFDGSNDIIEVNDTDDINTGGPYDKKTIFVAFRTGTDVGTRQMLYEEGGGVRGLSIYIDAGLLYVNGWNEADDDAGATTPWPNDGSGAPYSLFRTFPVVTNTNYFVTMQFDFDVDLVGTDGEVRGGLNGAEPLDVIQDAGRLFSHPGDIGIGGKNDGTVYHDNVNGGGTNSFNGNIAEVMVTNFVFNDAQRRIITNYFSSKYDIAIDASGDDLFAHDANYSFDIVGIGRENAGNVHNEARGTGILKISNPSDIGDGEYLLIGHNGSSVNSWETTGVPNNDPDNFRKVARVWRADETGDVGDISIELINSQFIAPPAGFDENYVLLVDTDEDFTSGSEIYQLIDNGGTFNVDNIDLTGDKYFTVAIAKGSIQFDALSSNALENTGSINIPVSVNYVVGQDVSVNYTVTGGTATGNGFDYVLADGIATVSAGSSSTNINLQINNDTSEESDETVEITLSNPSAGTSLGDNTVHTFTLNDDDTPRKANFSLVSITNDESVTSYDLEVTLSETDSDNITTITYEVDAGSTATNGDDFSLTSPGTVVFPTDNASQTITISVTDDGIDEDSEQIIINLISADNASLGTQTTFTYEITDNDNEPSVGFASAASSDIESITAQNLEVTLSAASSKTITVDYAVNVSSTATSGGVDFNLVPGTLTFLPGVTSQNVPLNIFDDAIQESDETVVVDLSGETNAALGTSQLTFTIIDDDGGLGLLGPGGVGNTLIGTQVSFWFNASQGVFSDAGTTPAINNDAVLQWNDQGNSGLNGEKDPNVNAPTYLSSVSVAGGKSFPAISFTGNEGLTIADDDLINTAGAGYNLKSTLVVFETPATLTGTQVIYEQGGGGNGLNIYLDGSTLRAGTWSSYPYIDLSATVSAGEFIVLIFETDAQASEIRWYGYGSTTGAISGTTAGMSAVLSSHGGDVGIGARINDTRYTTGTAADDGDYFNGKIFEILQLNERITNTANRKILLSYAEAVYGIDIATGDDRYAFEATSYFNELLGIGQDDTDNRHLSAQGTGIVRLTSPQSVDNGDFLLIAHDGQDVEDFNTTELDASISSYVSRLDREWKVDETGDLGNIRFHVDTTALPGLPGLASDYLLIVDTDQNGDFTDGALDYYTLDERFGEFALSNNVDLVSGDVFTVGAAINVANTSGDWNNPVTWLLATVPASDDRVEIVSPSVINLDADVTVSELIIDAGSTLNLNNFTLTITSTLDLQGTINAGTGTVAYTSTSGNVCVEPMTYYNLEIAGSGTKTLCGDIIVENDLTINNSPILDTDALNNYNITLRGNWINAISSAFTPQQGNVIFDGGALQTISKTGTAEQFYNLELSNPNNVEILSNVTVNNQLNFVEDGLIFTGSNTLDIENSGLTAINGYSSSRYIVTNGGQVQREVVAGNSYDIPVGDATYYTPLVFDYTSGTVTDLNASVTNSAHPNINTAGNYIARYWTLEPVAGSANYNVVYTYDQTDFNGISESNMKPVKYGSFQVGTTDMVNVATNECTWNGLTSFSDFSAGNDVALPVELIYFEGSFDRNRVVLSWATAAEVNNSHFELFRAGADLEFRKIGEIEGAGNASERIEYEFIDNQPNDGLNYYQLKQVDFDGKHELFDIIVVEANMDNIPVDVVVYPNPSNGKTTRLDFTGLTYGEEFILTISDLRGMVMMRENMSYKGGSLQLVFEKPLEPGIYLIKVDTEDALLVRRLMVR